ncbi:MAP kinase kinase skh1/pek1 [Fusarium oxysporum f. sp. albedinis]|nr:MAP kinase kinase skh1/pek1 [Fusarium oxysporum f. sp. albedinis]
MNRKKKEGQPDHFLLAQLRYQTVGQGNEKQGRVGRRAQQPAWGTTYAQLLLRLLLAVNSICCCPDRCQHCCPARLIVQDLVLFYIVIFADLQMPIYELYVTLVQIPSFSLYCWASMPAVFNDKEKTE